MDRSYFMRQVMAGHGSEIGYSCWLGFIVRELGHGGLQGQNVQKGGLGESVPYLGVELCHMMSSCLPQSFVLSVTKRTLNKSLFLSACFELDVQCAAQLGFCVCIFDRFGSSTTLSAKTFVPTLLLIS